MKPSLIRFWVAGLLTLMAVLLYLDRYAVGIASEQMRADLGMTQTQMSWFLSAFFWSYALSQVPAGWLSDRWGPRIMLTVYILSWSLFTGLLGVAYQVWVVLLLRFLCGAAQAGAYPVCSAMIRSWFPISRRGLASSVVSMGGRFGAVLAPLLTASMMTAYSGNWRPVLLWYGGFGIIVSLAFAMICRDTPREHPACNEVERALIEGETASLGLSLAATTHPSFPWLAVLTNISLWGNCLTQFLSNIGWLFVVTWLPRYLGDVHQVPLQEQAVMTALPTLAAVVGMFGGGWWTDRATRKYGLKWGRRLPVMATRFMAAAAFGVCLLLGMWCTPDPDSRWLPWSIVACLSVATLCSDLGVPAIWAYSQDVGGKYTASVMGWSNMFGNFGAAVAPLVYNSVLGETPTLGQWNLLFAVCTGMFVLSGGTALLIDATQMISSDIKPAE